MPNPVSIFLMCTSLHPLSPLSLSRYCVQLFPCACIALENLHCLCIGTALSWQARLSPGTWKSAPRARQLMQQGAGSRSAPSCLHPLARSCWGASTVQGAESHRQVWWSSAPTLPFVTLLLVWMAKEHRYLWRLTPNFLFNIEESYQPAKVKLHVAI